MSARKQRLGWTLVATVCGVAAHAQVPDLLNAFDAGGRAMALGGGSAVTDSDTRSALNNPATLAYVREPMFRFDVRNLPDSTVNVTGSFVNRTNTTDPGLGKNAITHLGYVTPYKDGTFGVSFTRTGYIKNRTTGDNLTNGSLTVRNLVEVTEATTDMFTFSYGRPSGRYNIGYGLVLANQYVNGSQRYSLFDSGNNNVGTVDSSASGNSYGVGAVFGIQSRPQADENYTWGASVRTPISLTGNSDTKDYLGRLPGKLSFGAAGRHDLPGRQDFFAWALGTDYYFGGDTSGIIERRNNWGFGGGVEYNLFKFNARIPLRIGYAYIPNGGTGFSDRNAFTLGIGYRPDSSPFSVDLSVAKVTGTGSGPYDLALGVTYKPGKSK
ncbi:MAG: hypothetical protein KF857_00620 [Fimbriimonadaceae bacterium]|nr:hypothetical protein [Fimbriimonadaceae bacterium]